MENYVESHGIISSCISEMHIGMHSTQVPWLCDLCIRGTDGSLEDSSCDKLPTTVLYQQPLTLPWTRQLLSLIHAKIGYHC